MAERKETPDATPNALHDAINLPLLLGMAAAMLGNLVPELFVLRLHGLELPKQLVVGSLKHLHLAEYAVCVLLGLNASENGQLTCETTTRRKTTNTKAQIYAPAPACAAWTSVSFPCV